MFQAFFCYVFALLFIANSVNTDILALQFLDGAAAGYFLVIGAITGWLAARVEN